MVEKCWCVLQKGIHSWLTLPRCLDGCCPCRAAEELFLLPVPVELLLPHPGTTVVPEGHRACEPELSIPPSFTASSPKHFQPDSQSHPNLAKAGVKHEACADLGGIWIVGRTPEDPCQWHHGQPRAVCCAWGQRAHPAHPAGAGTPKLQQGASSSARREKPFQAQSVREGTEHNYLLEQQLVILTCQSSQNAECESCWGPKLHQQPPPAVSTGKLVPVPPAPSQDKQNP